MVPDSALNQPEPRFSPGLSAKSLACLAFYQMLAKLMVAAFSA